jgi:hypothetical protein
MKTPKSPEICTLSNIRRREVVADPQQHSPKSASMALQPYAAAIASHMVARGLGQILDWEFQ